MPISPPLIEELVQHIREFATTASAILLETELWAAIIGAVAATVGAYIVQSRAFSVERRRRDEDRRLQNEVLGASLIFKLLSIQATYANVFHHIDSHITLARESGRNGKNWQNIPPLVNVIEYVHFSAEEMAMLIGLEDLSVANGVLGLDVRHNSMIEAVKFYASERRSLTDRLTAAQIDGNLVSGNLTSTQHALLAPKMLEVESIVVNLAVIVRDGFKDADAALHGAQTLFHDKLGFKTKFETIRHPPS